MTVGCLLGMLLLKLMDSRTVLMGAAVLSMGALAAALFGPATVSLYAFPLVGFCLSVMWSIIFALALNSVAEHHGSFSGILCTAIVGGAVAPLVVGWLGRRASACATRCRSCTCPRLHPLHRLLGAPAGEQRDPGLAQGGDGGGLRAPWLDQGAVYDFPASRAWKRGSSRIASKSGSWAIQSRLPQPP